MQHDTDSFPAMPSDRSEPSGASPDVSLVEAALAATDDYLESAAASGRSVAAARRGRREWLIRTVLMVGGLCFAQIGVSLFVLTAIGSEPYTVFTQGLSVVFGYSIGLCHLAVTSLFLAFFVVFARRYILPGTFAGTFFAGPFLDMYTWLFGGIVTAGLATPIRLGLAVLGCVIIGIGLSLIIRADAGMGPNDLVPVFTAEKLRCQYRWVKITFDSVLVATGFVLGGVVGVGTVLSVVLVGPVAQFFFPTMDRLVGAVLARTGCAAA
ncbi:MAG: DUF6198 family protein [Planctomycetes bacterium]|nr:DUF6198 family protein [Planctomycetota bacterium]